MPRAAALAQPSYIREVRPVSSIDGLNVVEVVPDRLADALAGYRADPTVVYAEPDHEIHVFDPPNDPEFGRLWGMRNDGQAVSGFFCFAAGTPGADIRAVDAWDIWTGDPEFRIAIIDTGVNYLHPDLAENIWTNPDEVPGNGLDDDANGWIDDVHGYDFINNDGDPMDDHRHGSHVAGTIGAVGDNGLGVAGVNHHCRIVALKVFDQFGRGDLSNAVLAMDYVIANGIRVSNNSWGCSGLEPGCFSQALFDVIEASQSVGHLFIAAAGNNFGNDNDEAPVYPVAFDLPNIIGVAAITNRDTLALFSNFGATTVDVGAPGTCIYSTILGDSYGFLDGTSMATPHVTGVVALVMSRLPDLSGPQVKQRLFTTVRPVAALTETTLTGGVVNAGAAVWDCNNNGIPDEQDIAVGDSDDCNNNLLPDECEPDCNANQVADECDITSGSSLDCSGNGIPDECEPDCNTNDVPDSCDIADGTSGDCDGDGNGIPDECEPDCNENDIADSCDIVRGLPDCNRNRIPDICEPGGGTDCNGNDNPDVCDIFLALAADCNRNAVPDECDVASGSSRDCTGNLRPDECEPDCNGNGKADSCDIANRTSIDCSGNGLPDECEPDCNNNDVADVCDIRDSVSADCNRNRVPDECEPGGLPENDCNGNGRPDLCDIYDRLARDCNSNAVLDPCDMQNGDSTDTDGDGVLDECEGKGFRLIPVDATGPHTLNDNEIVLDEAGQRVELEIRVSGWDLDGDGFPKLRGFQPEIDASGFKSALYGTLSLAKIRCASDNDCPIWQAQCQDNGFCVQSASVGIDLTRPDYVFFNVISVWVVNFITRAPNIIILSAIFSQLDSVVDGGTEKYGATVLLDVSPLAGGTFTVGFEDDFSFFGTGSSDDLTIPSFTPALITIPSDCNANDVPDQEDIDSGTSLDCNRNGIPDDCLNVEPDCNDNSVPDDCDIVRGDSQDCTGDGTPDECEPDCNNNRAADSCDIAGGLSVDINVNAVPDECDPRLTLYVDTVNCFFPGAGTEDDPYCNIQFAIENAGTGRDAVVEIIVADGVYRGFGNKNIEFGGRALTLRSGGGPANCIIDAEGDGRAFIFRQGDDDVFVEGFTMINGSSASGGAVFIQSSSPTLRQCIMKNNYALRFGGGVYVTRGRPKFERCVISDNIADFFYGGGMYCILADPVFNDSMITRNDGVLGGAIFGSTCNAVIEGGTLAYNGAESRGGALYFTGGGSRPTLSHSILWGNESPLGPEIFLSSSARLTAKYSDIRGGVEGSVATGAVFQWQEGNVDIDPRFTDSDNGDFHLAPISPCIDAGDPARQLPVGARDVDGNARRIGDAVDIGADEAVTFADCDGDGVPDGKRLIDGSGADCNANDTLDDCDIAAETSADVIPAEGDGRPDECQTDCNGNRLPDDTEIAAGVTPDCNANDIPDDCDITSGYSADCDGRGVPDECDIFGDVDDNGHVNIFDCFCVLDGFIGVFSRCAFAEIDIGLCSSDGLIDIYDLFAVLDAYQGINACCPSESRP